MSKFNNNQNFMYKFSLIKVIQEFKENEEYDRYYHQFSRINIKMMKLVKDILIKIIINNLDSVFPNVSKRKTKVMYGNIRTTNNTLNQYFFYDIEISEIIDSLEDEVELFCKYLDKLSGMRFLHFLNDIKEKDLNYIDSDEINENCVDETDILKILLDHELFKFHSLYDDAHTEAETELEKILKDFCNEKCLRSLYNPRHKVGKKFVEKLLNKSFE